MFVEVVQGAGTFGTIGTTITDEVSRRLARWMAYRDSGGLTKGGVGPDITLIA
jgi:hypothetical protein